MAIRNRSALIISSNVNDLDPLEGVYQDAAGASKVLMGMKIKPECAYGGEFSLAEFMEKIEKFFGKESEVHILWGIFHGEVASDGEKQMGCWVLFNHELVNLCCILQKWYFARDKGTANHLLIISDACYSGHMVTEAAKLELKDVSIQASCHPSFTSLDTEGQSFSDLLVMILKKHHGPPMSTTDHLQDPCGIAEGIVNRHQPRFYSAVDPPDLGWVFVDESSYFFCDSSGSSSSSDSSDCANATPAGNDEGSLLVETNVPKRSPLSKVIALCLFPLLAREAAQRMLHNNIKKEVGPLVAKKCFNQRVPLRHTGFGNGSMQMLDTHIANPASARVSVGMSRAVPHRPMTWPEWADCLRLNLHR